MGHRASFILVGSGNPEEGELRPQLLDRFGLFVSITSLEIAGDRTLASNLRKSFEKNPELLKKKFIPITEELKVIISSAKSLLVNDSIVLSQDDTYFSWTERMCKL